MFRHQSDMVTLLVLENNLNETETSLFIRACKVLFNKFNKQKGSYVEDINCGYTVVLRDNETLYLFRNPVKTFYFTTKYEH